jgi:hypothetical protein
VGVAGEQVVTTAELEAEIIDALRFGASPVTGIAERVHGEPEEVLEVLLELEGQDLVRRRPATNGRLAAHQTWWELTARGDAVTLA